MEAAARMNVSIGSPYRSPARPRDAAAAVTAVAGGSPAPRSHSYARALSGSPLPAGKSGTEQAEFEEMAVMLHRHSAKARALAEELACRTASDDWRPLLGPLVTFQSSLLDMQQVVLDAIAELAARPSRSPTSTALPLAAGLRGCQATAFVSAQSSNSGVTAALVTEDVKEVVESLRLSSEGAEVVQASASVGMFFGGGAEVSGRAELLCFVQEMLSRKRDDMLSEGVQDANKFRELEEDLARVELELAMLVPAEEGLHMTPQKFDSCRDNPTPSQGSTATPWSSTSPPPQPENSTPLDCSHPTPQSSTPPEPIASVALRGTTPIRGESWKVQFSPPPRTSPLPKGSPYRRSVVEFPRVEFQEHDRGTYLDDSSEPSSCLFQEQHTSPSDLCSSSLQTVDKAEEVNLSDAPKRTSVDDQSDNCVAAWCMSTESVLTVRGLISDEAPQVDGSCLPEGEREAQQVGSACGAADVEVTTDADDGEARGWANNEHLPHLLPTPFQPSRGAADALRAAVSPVQPRAAASPVHSRAAASPVPSRSAASPAPSRANASPAPSRAAASPVPATPEREMHEAVARQRNATDAVLIGSARQVQGNHPKRSSPARGGRSARHSPVVEHAGSSLEPEVCSRNALSEDCHPAARCLDQADQADRPAWCWGGDMLGDAPLSAGAPITADTSNFMDSPDSPSLLSTSRCLYETPGSIDSHVYMSMEMDPGAPRAESNDSRDEMHQNRAPLRNLPPPWAFQGGQLAAATAASSATLEMTAAVAKSVFKGKENAAPPPIAPAPLRQGAAYSAPVSPAIPPPAKHPPKAPPTLAEVEQNAAGLSPLLSDQAAPRAASTPGRRLPPTSAGAFFRNTPSPKAGTSHKSPDVFPRSLLFASPSPHRYSTASEQDVFEWASPIESCDDPSAGTAAGSNDSPKPPQNPRNNIDLPTVQAPLPLHAGRPPAVDWRLPNSLRMTGGSSASGSPAKQGDSPARLGARGSPVRVVGSPARPGGNSPARSITPARHFLKSPSAPSLMASPARSSSSASAQNQRPGSASRSSGDTPRNLTDWRKSLQMARRKEEPQTAVPWR